jgi:drug/metabolite transporter (DMT)-like permease
MSRPISSFRASQVALTSDDPHAIVAAAVSVVLWASAFVGIRAVTADLSPTSLALGRLLVGSIALGVLSLTRSWVRPGRRDLVRILASGLTWFAIYNVVLNTAERSVDAGVASMLVNTGPIFIAILAGLFLREGFPPRLLVGCAIAFGGAAIIGVSTSSADAASGISPIGVVLCIVAAIAYAVGVTVQKPALRSLPAIEVTFLACATGAVLLLPAAPGLVANLGTASASSIGWLVYLGLFPTAIAFTTWSFALSRTTAGRLGSTTYFVPPVVIAMSLLLLAEVPAPTALVGGVLCIGGAVVARSQRALNPFRRTAVPAQS